MLPISRLKNMIAMCVVVACSAVGLVTTAGAASPSIVNTASQSGLAMVSRTWAVSTVDYNNDGLEDIWLGFHANAESKLMRNNGNGTYTWVAQGTWMPRNSQKKQIDRHDCAWADVDGNGLQDAYCSVGRNSMNQVKTALIDNELWLQLTSGVFTDKGTEWGLGDPCGRGRYVAFLDVNNDGWQDLFVGNDSPRPVTPDPCDNPANGYPNENAKMFINLQGQGFRAAPEWNVNQKGVGNSCAVPFDFNKDGRVDLLTCHYVSHRPYLFQNTGTGFKEVGVSLGLTTGISDAEVGDINNDGIADLVTSRPAGFAYRLGTATGLGPQVNLGLTPGGSIWGWGVAIGDINNDGTKDVYGLVRDDTMLTNPDDMLFVNDGHLNFQVLTPPSATGDANAVSAVYASKNSPAQFIVLNGREQMDGPIQLIGYSATVQ